MKAEFKKVLQLFEELEGAGESATLTILSRKGISTIKLLLESSPTLPTTSTTTPTLPPAPGKRRRHRGAKARAAVHRAFLAEAASGASPDPPHPFRHLLPGGAG